MAPGWTVLDGHQEHSGSGSTELQHYGTGLNLSPQGPLTDIDIQTGKGRWDVSELRRGSFLLGV